MKRADSSGTERLNRGAVGERGRTDWCEGNWTGFGGRWRGKGRWRYSRRWRKAIPVPLSLADRCICQSVADVSGSFYVVTQPVVIIAHFYLATVTVHPASRNSSVILSFGIIEEFIAGHLRQWITVNQTSSDFLARRIVFSLPPEIFFFFLETRLLFLHTSIHHL